MATRLALALSRRKTFETDTSVTKLARVLTLLDLTALGVGSTLGLGVYVLAGSVAKTESGPSVCIAFLVAAIASAVAGLCYAEFAARVPRAGSAYVYSYVSVGEFVAYVIGWNLILEYVIGTASVARGLSNYIDALADNAMRNALREAMPMNVDYLSTYPDFFAFVMILILAVLLAVGVKESTFLNNLFTLVNLLTVATVIISGAIKSDADNWNIPKEQIPPNVDGGDGGFAPWGFAGIMAGAATCFYGFVGFDCVATTGEEAKNPQRDIPLSIVISLIIIFLAYFGVSTVLTMMWPYYDQDADAPFPYVFDQVGWPAIKWIVTVGAIFALCTSLLGAMFPLPRILYAMASDGLIFKFLAKVHPRTQTPIIATMLSGLLAGLMALIFDLQQLINMMSIGTLLAYTIVAICVLLLRYQPDEETDYPNIEMNDLTKQKVEIQRPPLYLLKSLFNLNMIKYPSHLSSTITDWATVIFTILSIGLCAIIIFAGSMINELNAGYITLLIVVGVVMLILVLIIARQPVSQKKLSFKVPWVPTIPCLSIVINFYLMLELDDQTWIRFGAWLAIGFLIYIFYGIHQSEQGKKTKVQYDGEVKRKSSSNATTASAKSEINGKKIIDTKPAEE